MTNQKRLLTFELKKDGDEIELHGNAQGLRHLISRIEAALKNRDHEHLMTAEWGGNDLSDEKQGEENELIHHVKLMFWDE